MEIMNSLRIFALLIAAATTAHGYLAVPNSVVIEEAEVDEPAEKLPADDIREAEPQNAQEVYIGPTLYYYESSLTWYSSAGLCDRFERVLCSYKELCPDTDVENGGKQLVHDVLSGDHWVAIQDNDWMQIGNAHGAPCISLKSLKWSASKTKWSRTSQSKPWKGYVFCCKEASPKPEPGQINAICLKEREKVTWMGVDCEARFERWYYNKDTKWCEKFFTGCNAGPNNFRTLSDCQRACTGGTDVILRFIGKTVTYDMSKHYCSYQGRRLCYSSEICVDDKPVYGASYGDHWVATSDFDNIWIQIGTSNGPICRRHRAEWGKRTDRSGLDYVGFVYCCK